MTNSRATSALRETGSTQPGTSQQPQTNPLTPKAEHGIDWLSQHTRHCQDQHFSRPLHNLSSLSQEARHPHPGNVGMPQTWASSSPIGGSFLCSEVSGMLTDDMWATFLNVHLSYNLISPFCKPK